MTGATAGLTGTTTTAGTDEPGRGTEVPRPCGDGFAALGIPLREGRLLTAADSRRPERVCVVDEDFVRHYWPQGGAIGQRLFDGGEEGSDAEAYTIVGVVAAVKQAGLTDEGQGAVFYPYGHQPSSCPCSPPARSSASWAPGSPAGP